MADATALRTRIDRQRINTTQAHERRHWSKQLGVSEEELLAAVQAVGPQVDKVREYVTSRKSG